MPGQAGRQYIRRELIAAVGVEPWANRAVLPHELDLPAREGSRLRLLAATETNLSPILVFFKRDGTGEGKSESANATSASSASDAVDAAWAWTAGRAPDATGADADGVGSPTLGAEDDPVLVDGLRAYFATRPLFIADGHHRYETALNYLEDCRQQAGGVLRRSPGPLRDDAPSRGG